MERALTDYNGVRLDAILELEPRKIGVFCDSALDAETLIEELEHTGPFAPLRKRFCEYLDIGESTLTGWLKDERIPRMAKVAYVLLVALEVLQNEVKRLRRNAEDLKVVRDGNAYHIVRFSDDGSGTAVGDIVARAVGDAETARVLAGSLRAFQMLEESQEVIQGILEHTGPDGFPTSYISLLEDLDHRITQETLAAFHPEKWRELHRVPTIEEL